MYIIKAQCQHTYYKDLREGLAMWDLVWSSSANLDNALNTLYKPVVALSSDSASVNHAYPSWRGARTPEFIMANTKDPVKLVIGGVDGSRDIEWRRFRSGPAKRSFGIRYACQCVNNRVNSGQKCPYVS